MDSFGDLPTEWQEGMSLGLLFIMGFLFLLSVGLIVWGIMMYMQNNPMAKVMIPGGLAIGLIPSVVIFTYDMGGLDFEDILGASGTEPVTIVSVEHKPVTIASIVDGSGLHEEHLT